ncbi:MAG: hypothetical protein V1809_07435 [Planctomycetota bacterium]
MDIQMAAICDAATEDQRGKLNILGAFDTIYARDFPVTHPHCAVAYRIRFSRLEAGVHRIKVTFVDADGRPILPPLEGEMNIHPAEEQDSTVANLILVINGLKIEKAGEHSIDMSLDGNPVKSLPLFVKKEPSESAG